LSSALIQAVACFAIRDALLIQHPGELSLDLAKSDREQGQADARGFSGEQRFKSPCLRLDGADLSSKVEHPAVNQ
jgi:hypothetical protein